jgi:hypothetical protein
VLLQILWSSLPDKQAFPGVFSNNSLTIEVPSSFFVLLALCPITEPVREGSMSSDHPELPDASWLPWLGYYLQLWAYHNGYSEVAEGLWESASRSKEYQWLWLFLAFW